MTEIAGIGLHEIENAVCPLEIAAVTSSAGPVLASKATQRRDNLPWSLSPHQKFGMKCAGGLYALEDIDHVTRCHTQSVETCHDL